MIQASSRYEQRSTCSAISRSSRAVGRSASAVIASCDVGDPYWTGGGFDRDADRAESTQSASGVARRQGRAATRRPPDSRGAGRAARCRCWRSADRGRPHRRRRPPWRAAVSVPAFERGEIGVAEQQRRAAPSAARPTCRRRRRNADCSGRRARLRRASADNCAYRRRERSRSVSDSGTVGSRSTSGRRHSLVSRMKTMNANSGSVGPGAGGKSIAPRLWSRADARALNHAWTAAASAPPKLNRCRTYSSDTALRDT